MTSSIKAILYRERCKIKGLVNDMPEDTQKIYLSEVTKAEEELDRLTADLEAYDKYRQNAEELVEQLATTWWWQIDAGQSLESFIQEQLDRLELV